MRGDKFAMIFNLRSPDHAANLKLYLEPIHRCNQLWVSVTDGSCAEDYKSLQLIMS